MPAPKALALRPTVSTAASGTAATHREEAPDRTGAQPQSSNAAVTALLAGGRVPPTSPPVPGRPASAAQDMFGNGAVAAAGQGQGGPAGPTAAAPTTAAAPPAATATAEPAPAAGGAPTRTGPHSDPKFAQLKRDVGHKKRTLAASHPPPRTEAAAAQDAALPPKDDTEAQGKTANAEKMNEAEPKDFDKDAFIRAVEKAI